MENNTIKIKFFNSIAEAQLIGNLLESCGVKNLVKKRGLEFPGDLGDFYGADLFVAERDVKKAKEILEIEE